MAQNRYVGDYPVIGIRPVIDGRWGGIREGLEAQTMGLAEAAKALIESGIPMENVGHLVGFTDYSAFYRAFRQEYGISPRQYRNRCLLPSAEIPRL